MRLPEKDLLEQIQGLLASDASDREIRDSFEAFGRDAGLDRHFAVWAPVLYRRNAVMFRGLILANIPPFQSWDEKLAPLLEAADGGNDFALFRRFFEWKIRNVGWKQREGVFREELRKRFQEASGPAGRAATLRKLEFEFSLDEALAIELFEKEPDVAGPYILKHLPYQQRDVTQLWEKLFVLARERGRESFAFALYREQASHDRWKNDVTELVRSELPPDALVAELETRHARSASMTTGEVWDELVRRHGGPVVGFVGRHVDGSRWQDDVREGLVELAEANGWWGLWARLVRDASTDAQYNAKIGQILSDDGPTDAERCERLRLIAGPRRGRWAFAPPLEPEVARRLYDTYPELFRRDFRVHLATAGQSHSELLDFFLERDDLELVDFYASILMTRRVHDYQNYREPPKAPPQTERLIDYYRALGDRDEAAFAARAKNVLTQVSVAHARILGENPLAQLFARSEPRTLLADETAVEELLESENDWVRAIALRTIADDDERSLAVTDRAFPLLIGMLLQPLRRDPRRHLHRALAKLGRADRDRAESIVSRCRVALEMTRRAVPKAMFAELLGPVIARWPELRKRSEVLPVHQRARAAS